MSQYTTADIAKLLNEELPDISAETNLYAAITGSRQLLLTYIRELVAADAVDSLTMLAHGDTPLHELLDRRGKSPIARATHGMASLGLALVDAEPAAAEHLESALRWLAESQICVPALQPFRPVSHKNRHADRMRYLAGHLEGSDFAATALVWLSDLDGADRSKRPGPIVEVLLDLGRSGMNATLRTRVLQGQPPALVPDPRSMTLFTADESFAAGLQTAWILAGRKIRGTVLWSLDDPDGPLDHVRDISLTAAFAVLLDEIRRTRRRVTGFWTVRRIASRTAVVGGVGLDGRMKSVQGYGAKMKAAAELDRVVVPKDDLASAQSHAGASQFEVKGAADWKGAAQASRRLNRRYLTRVLVSTVLVLSLASVSGGWLWWRQNQRQHTLDTANKVATEATDMASGDSGGLAMLLAMASDDIAARAGQKTSVFETMAQNQATLVKILRPSQGSYHSAVISPDGTVALVATNMGSVQLVSTAAGRTLWQRNYPPGLELSPQQVFIGGTALSQDGRQAAVATSDMTITLLAPHNATWDVSSTLTIPAARDIGPFGEELNTVKMLQFSPDGKSLDAYGERSGLFRFKLTAPYGFQHCAEPNDVTALSESSTGVLLVRPQSIVKVSPQFCSSTTVLTAPGGSTLWTAVTGADGVPVGFVTNGSQLLAVRSGEPDVLLSDRGPYSAVNAAVSSNGSIHVSASTHAGTFGWRLDDRAQEFGLRASGIAAVSAGPIVWVHDGIAEIHDRGHTPDTIRAVRMSAVQSVGWTGPDLIIAGFAYVDVAPGGANGLVRSKVRQLVSSKDITVTQIATSPHNPWAAAVIRDRPVAEPKAGSGRTFLRVWDVPSGRELQVVGPADDIPVHAAFSDRNLYVAYSHGDLRRFQLRGDRWEQSGQVQLPAYVRALASRDGEDSVYAAVSNSANSHPTVVKVHGSDLAVVATTALPGPIGTDSLTVLQDGEVVLGYGAGQVTFLDPDLSVRGTFTDSTLTYINNVTEIPGLGQVMVSGRTESLVLDRTTHARLASAWDRGSPFFSASASPDGRVFVTDNYLGAEVDFWSLDQPSLRARVCQAIGRDLSRDEWERFVGSGQPYHPVC